MEKKKKGVMQSIPGWAWVLISLAAAILLWYALSINPKTARSFPFIPAILEAAKRMIDNGALGQDFCSSMISILRSEERRVGKECRSRWSPYH